MGEVNIKVVVRETLVVVEELVALVAEVEMDVEEVDEDSYLDEASLPLPRQAPPPLLRLLPSSSSSRGPRSPGQAGWPSLPRPVSVTPSTRMVLSVWLSSPHHTLLSVRLFWIFADTGFYTHARESHLPVSVR